MQAARRSSTTLCSTTTTTTRSFASSSKASYALPPKYGSGPLYVSRTTSSRLAPKDAITHAESPMLRMLMFGKPGSGKGTLSSKLIAKYNVTQLSAGDILRAHIAEGTQIGQLAESIIASGGLIPDDIMTKVITSKLDPLHKKHWILDGFPRTVGQGRLLDERLRSAATPITLIVNLDIPDDVILSRISDRWVHLPSGRVYNSSYNKPRIAGRDDVTGEVLTRRPDDNPEIFARRLRAFYESTSPLLSYYSSPEALASTKMVTLTGASSDEIWPKLEQIVASEFRLKPTTPSSTTVTLGTRKTSVQEAMFRMEGQGPLYRTTGK